MVIPFETGEACHVALSIRLVLRIFRRAWLEEDSFQGSGLAKLGRAAKWKSIKPSLAA